MRRRLRIPDFNQRNFAPRLTVGRRRLKRVDVLHWNPERQRQDTEHDPAQLLAGAFLIALAVVEFVELATLGPGEVQVEEMGKNERPFAHVAPLPELVVALVAESDALEGLETEDFQAHVLSNPAR